MLTLLQAASALGPPVAPPFARLGHQVEELSFDQCASPAHRAILVEVRIDPDGSLATTVLEPSDLRRSERRCVQRTIARHTYAMPRGSGDPRSLAGTSATVWIELGERPPLTPSPPFTSTMIGQCIDVRAPHLHEPRAAWLEDNAIHDVFSPEGTLFQLDDTTWVRWNLRGWAPHQACVESLPVVLAPLRRRETGPADRHGPVTLHVDDQARLLRTPCRYRTDSVLRAVDVLAAHDLPAEVARLGPLPSAPQGYTLRFWGPRLIAADPGPPAHDACMPLAVR